MLPRAVSEHYRAQQRLIVAALGLTRREWATMGGDWDASWAKIAPRVNLLTASAQLGAASSGAAYVAATLDEYGESIDALGTVNPRAFAGVASDGRPLGSLLDGALYRAKGANSLEAGGKWLDMAVHTQVADASRGAAATAIAVRPGVGWVRMVNPPCCGPCAVLSGREYRYSHGFQRHPRCDCVHVPTTIANPGSHFGVDPTLDQITDLTEGERRALLEGGDLSRVINARRGGGLGKMTTTELAKRGQVRLTPDGIFAQAKNRDEALALLQRHGYITPTARRVSTNVARVVEPKGNDAAAVFARAFDGGEVEIDALRLVYQDEMNRVLNARGYSAEVEAYTTDYDAIARVRLDSPRIVMKTVVKDAAGDEAGDLYRTFERLAGDEGLAARHDFFSLRPAHQGKGLASDLGPVMEDWYRSAGVRHIDLEANIDVGGYTWAKKGYDWAPGSDVVGRDRIAARLVDEAEFESDEVRALAQEYATAFDGPRSQWPAPYDVAMLGWQEGATEWFGKLLMMDSKWQGRKIL